MAFYEVEQGPLLYMKSDTIPVRHAFTTRYGGVSSGAFESLNLGSNIGDPQSNVEENYRRVCGIFGVGADDCAVTRQIHSGIVRIVDSTDRHRCGERIPYDADGIVTACKGLPLLCFTADCTPVLLCDEKNGVCAAVHCGWRGSVADILGNAVSMMLELGAGTENIHAAIGPSISACCFETDRDVPDAVLSWLGTDRFCTLREDGKYLVDLKAANAFRLMQLGVPADNIDISPECTFCSHDRYWSHRYTHGKRGVQCAGIML